MMKRTAWFSVLGLLIAAVSGCVERRMTIVSNPPGAMASLNNYEIGATPVDVPSHLFVYYGDYDIKLVRDGYEPLLVKQAVPAPWYEYPIVDFVSENAIPWHIKDKHVFAYDLLPTRVVPTEELLRNAESQRSRGQGIGAPLANTPPNSAVQLQPPQP